MRKKNGFTLVELISVIAIISLILLVAVPSVSSFLANYNNKEESKREVLVGKAVELYLVDEPELYNKITKQACYLKLGDIPMEYQVGDKEKMVYYDKGTMTYHIVTTPPDDYVNCL